MRGEFAMWQVDLVPKKLVYSCFFTDANRKCRSDQEASEFPLQNGADTARRNWASVNGQNSLMFREKIIQMRGNLLKITMRKFMTQIFNIIITILMSYL